MFRAILYVQWKWARIIVALGTVTAFALPVLSLQQAGAGRASHTQAAELLHVVGAWGVLYPVLATALALIVAVTAWAPDHRGGHVYALSLPLPPWRYALLRLGAGATLLGPPVAALWVGALVATGAATLPPGLQSYATSLAIRFALAVAVAYALFFAISAGTTRTAGAILGVAGAVLILDVLAGVADVDLHIVERLQLVVMNWPGPLAIFTGRWMLIDV